METEVWCLEIIFKEYTCRSTCRRFNAFPVWKRVDLQRGQSSQLSVLVQIEGKYHTCKQMMLRFYSTNVSSKICHLRVHVLCRHLWNSETGTPLRKIPQIPIVATLHVHGYYVLTKTHHLCSRQSIPDDREGVLTEEQGGHREGRDVTHPQLLTVMDQLTARRL